MCQACASSVFYPAMSPAGWISSVLELLTVFIAQGVCRYFRRIQILLKSSILLDSFNLCQLVGSGLELGTKFRDAVLAYYLPLPLPSRNVP